MRQASWEDMFRAEEEKPSKPPVWSRLVIFSWEEVVTLLIVLIGFITVIQSINSANWVPEMPPLYTIAFVGLMAGLVLARLRLHELLAHLTALAIGAVAVVYTATSRLSGSLPDRVSELADRMHLWANALYSGGISTDNLPFVLLVVALCYLAAYLAAWSIFRWYNAWFALIPGGLALLTNISYLPGQKSFSLLIYIFCSILLVARVNLLRQARQWRSERTGYPDLISLHVLNVTVWMALALLAFAWLLPVGNGSGALFSLWEKATSPVVGPASSLSRVFSAIDSKKGSSVHKFGSTLPLQGQITLGGGEVMTVSAAEPGFLRAQSYDFYTAQGWKLGPASQITASAWPALKAMQSVEESRRQQRRPVTIQVTNSRDSNVIVSDGEPLAVSVESRVVFGPDPADVTSVRPTGTHLNKSTQYRVDSTLTNASVPRLRAALPVYPPWISPYLQLPSDLPRTIVRKSRDVTAGTDNAYDKATAIEQYLRTFAIETKITPAPPNRDSVDYFLNDLGKGYFDYHASAMVVMLRTLGIPARLAVGYTIRVQDRVPDTNIYTVTDANSFAWPEVYFPSLGWVEFNPTPNEPKINRSGADDPAFAGSGDEEMVDDSLGDTGLTDATGEAASAIDQLQVDQGSHLVSRILLSIVLGVLALTAVGGGIFQFSWQRGLGGLDYPVQIWEKTLRLARWSRIRPLPQETPREVISRLQRELPQVDDLDYLGEAFIRSRYGHKELQPDEKERLTSVWKKARNDLLTRLLHWK